MLNSVRFYAAAAVVVVIFITFHLITMTIVITIAGCVLIDLQKNSFNNNTKNKMNLFEEKTKHSVNSMNS